MEKLERLRDIDDEIFEEFKKAIEHLPNLLNKSEFPYTAEVCFMYINGANFLKNSIFDCTETDDFYSVNVLFRSIIEHFLRFKYFWFNDMKTKDDSFAFKFRTAIDFNERIAMEKSLNAIRQLENVKSLSSDEIWTRLIQQNKDFEKFTKKEIYDFSREISFKNIIRYIEKTMKDGGYPLNDFLKNLLIQYSQMSSFVHGGLYAHKKMVTMEMESDRKDKMIAVCGLALQSASFIKLFSYLMFYQFKPEFGPIYNETDRLIKLINN